MTTNGHGTMTDWLAGEKSLHAGELLTEIVHEDARADGEAVGLTAIPSRHRAPICAPVHFYDRAQQVTESLPISDQASENATARIFSDLEHTGEDMIG